MRPRALVVGAYPQEARPLPDLLARYDIRSVATPSGREALDSFYLWVPDLVVCSLALPDMEGPELVREIREASSETLIGLVAEERDWRLMSGMAHDARTQLLRAPIRGRELRSLLARVFNGLMSSLD